MLRVWVQDFLRKTHLLSLAEKFRYHQKRWSLKKANQAFIAAFPEFRLPPGDLAFDAYSAPDWDFYKRSGEGTAVFLAGVMRKYLPVGSGTGIYEWGCGPGRVIRHLPGQLGPSVQVFGSDYNPRTIEWCRENISGVRFALNGLNPPLPYPGDQFDFVYCLSVFTHLSEQTCIRWAEEIHRVLKPGGIFLATTSGDNAFQKEMLDKEKKAYQSEGVLVRGHYEEGKKMYLTRHNPSYVRDRLLRQFRIEEHVPGGFPFMDQDYWIARKTEGI